MDNNLNQEELILVATNNFYIKYKDLSYNASEEDWVRIVNEARKIHKTYPVNLCNEILIRLLNVLNNNHKKKGKR